MSLIRPVNPTSPLPCCCDPRRLASVRVTVHSALSPSSLYLLYCLSTHNSSFLFTTSLLSIPLVVKTSEADHSAFDSTLVACRLPTLTSSTIYTLISFIPHYTRSLQQNGQPLWPNWPRWSACSPCHQATVGYALLCDISVSH